MNTTLATFLKLGFTASLIVVLVWGLLGDKMMELADKVANLIP